MKKQKNDNKNNKNYVRGPCGSLTLGPYPFFCFKSAGEHFEECVDGDAWCGQAARRAGGGGGQPAGERVYQHSPTVQYRTGVVVVIIIITFSSLTLTHQKETGRNAEKSTENYSLSDPASDVAAATDTGENKHARDEYSNISACKQYRMIFRNDTA